MPKKRTPRQRKAAQERARAQRRLAAAERFREEHARIVAERAGDPRFVHRVTEPNGATTIRWDAGTPADREIRAAMAEQGELFKQKFGREPGPADPVFFDPDADEPRPLSLESFDSELAELADRAAETGVDPAFIHAWRELGYLVTDENRHMFSAEDTAAWRDAVLRHRGEQDFDDDAYDGELFDDEDDADSLVEQLTDGVEILVAELLRETDPEVVPRFLDAVVVPFDDEEAQRVMSLVVAVLLAWITGAREHGLGPADPDSVLSWIRTNLGEHAETTAGALGGLLDHPTAPDLTLDEAVTQLGEHFIAGLVWLATGVAATAGGGDAHWLRQFDPDDHAGPPTRR